MSPDPSEIHPTVAASANKFAEDLCDSLPALNSHVRHITNHAGKDEIALLITTLLIQGQPLASRHALLTFLTLAPADSVLADFLVMCLSNKLIEEYRDAFCPLGPPTSTESNG